MRATDLVLNLIRIFEESKIAYMLVGSYSTNFYGRDRATNDADFVVVVDGTELAEIARKLGSDFKIDPQMSFETISMTTRYIFHHPATAFKIELFLLSNDAHDQARFGRRIQVNFEGRGTYLPTPEDVVVTKLRWSKAGKRSKDVLDVAQVLAVQSGNLDLPYIRGWCDQHGTRGLFETLFAESARFQQEQP